MQALWSAASTEPGCHVYQDARHISEEGPRTFWSSSGQVITADYVFGASDIKMKKKKAFLLCFAYIPGAFSWDTFFQKTPAVKKAK